MLTPTKTAVPEAPPRSDTSPEPNLPVLRPRLPSADRLFPYLQRIDATRSYTNFGPLVLEFESRLAAILGARPGAIASASTGTAALEATILAIAGRATRERPLALLPAFTFVATAVAVEACGYQPFLLDVDSDTWMLDPERLLGHPMLARAGVVVAVAPFGLAPAQAAWAGFARKTGLPVVIDAAASLEAVSGLQGACLGEVPVMLSFHATKSFGIGEGGCVACGDPHLAARITQSLNFGFREARDSRVPGINGKLSEYHAAVGLAELDGWQAKRAQFGLVHAAYARLAADAGLGDRMILAPRVAACYALFRTDDASQALGVQAALDQAGIGHRLWYGGGLHTQSRFHDAARDAMPVTGDIAPCLIGLPVAPDLTHAQVARVIAALRRSLVHG